MVSFLAWLFAWAAALAPAAPVVDVAPVPPSVVVVDVAPAPAVPPVSPGPPAPVVDEPPVAGYPESVECAAGEEWQYGFGCVAVQLPEERTGRG